MVFFILCVKIFVLLTGGIGGCRPGHARALPGWVTTK